MRQNSVHLISANFTEEIQRKFKLNLVSVVKDSEFLSNIAYSKLQFVLHWQTD